MLDLRTGYLVYAKGNEEPARRVVRRSGIEVRCHSLDLGQEPEELLAQVHDLARLIAKARMMPEVLAVSLEDA